MKLTKMTPSSRNTSASPRPARSRRKPTGAESRARRGGGFKPAIRRRHHPVMSRKRASKLLEQIAIPSNRALGAVADRAGGAPMGVRTNPSHDWLLSAATRAGSNRMRSAPDSPLRGYDKRP